MYLPRKAEIAPSDPNAVPTTIKATLIGWALRPLKILRTGNPAATVDRLFESKHVNDLRFIAAAAVVGLISLLVILAIGFVVLFEINIQLESDKFEAGERLATILVAGFGVFGLVLAWAYQVGSARLGVVDLFACEISTLCRVVTIADVVKRYVERFDTGPSVSQTERSNIPAYRFASKEGYFPVFENGTRDLETLEARVVVHITEFYTYMKSFRDHLRTLSETTPMPSELVSSNDLKQIPLGSWHEAIVKAVYMLFLCLESARKAIDDLVEFDPEHAEREVVILISELEAYRFLCARFTDKDDMHYLRLQLREDDYKTLVLALCNKIEEEEANENKQKREDSRSKNRRGWEPATGSWKPAARLVPTLRERYAAAIPAICPQ
jgi:hypothetical protein